MTQTKSFEHKLKVWKSIFLAVVSAGPSSKPVYYFSVFICVGFFPLPTDVCKDARSGAEADMYSCLGIHLEVNVVCLVDRKPL